MKSIIEEALKRLEEKIKVTNARVHVANGFHGLRVDRAWATQAVYNLIANALKFTRNGEPPDVEVVPYRAESSEANLVGIRVRDRGPGVAPEHAERIFQLFQRAVGRERAAVALRPRPPRHARAEKAASRGAPAPRLRPCGAGRH